MSDRDDRSMGRPDEAVVDVSPAMEQQHLDRQVSLVYAILGDDNLVLLPENVAIAVAEDVEAIRQLKTFGEARRFEPQFLIVPGLDDDDYDEPQTDDESYGASLTVEYQNDDWPPNAATIALDALPDDLDDLGEQREGFPGSPLLYIDPTTELALVAMLRARGFEIRRDDELISRI